MHVFSLLRRRVIGIRVWNSGVERGNSVGCTSVEWSSLRGVSASVDTRAAELLCGRRSVDIVLGDIEELERRECLHLGMKLEEFCYGEVGGDSGCITSMGVVIDILVREVRMFGSIGYPQQYLTEETDAQTGISGEGLERTCDTTHRVTDLELRTKWEHRCSMGYEDRVSVLWYTHMECEYGHVNVRLDINALALNDRHPTYHENPSDRVKMDNPNITMEEYIRLEEEKARRRGKVYNWETATYGKIWDNEDVHDLGSVKTEFLAIVFNDTLTSETTLSCEPMVISLNNDEINFRISFGESDDEDCTVIFDKNSFSYKIIYVNDLKTDSENDNKKVNIPSFSSPELTVSCFDDLDFFKDFDYEFLAIVYNDALTYKSDFLIEPTVSPQHIDEFDLKDETSLSECDEEAQNVLYFNDVFPFNVIYPDDSKSDKDNDDDKINIKQSSGGNFVIMVEGDKPPKDKGVASGSNGGDIDQFDPLYLHSNDINGIPLIGFKLEGTENVTPPNGAWTEYTCPGVSDTKQLSPEGKVGQTRDPTVWPMQAPLRARFKDLPTVDMKEILQQRMFEDNSYKAYEAHIDLYEALQKSFELDYSNQRLANHEEARKKKRKKRAAPRTSSGSPPSLPPPPPPPVSASGAPGSKAPSSSKPAVSTHQSIAWTTSDTRFALTGFTAAQELYPTDSLMQDDSIPDEQVNKTVLTQADFKGQAYEVVKAFYPDAIHLQFQMEEYHTMLTTQVDWTNLEGDHVRIDVNRPLPLGGPLGHVTIQPQFFFNTDLEYLRYFRASEAIPALAISKKKGC
ncbi:hypothetical protein Tco_0898305 [Tanacetum coccineum]